MALIAHFSPKSMDTKTYAEIMRRLDAAGLAAPTGRIHHAAYGPPDALHVVDIFDTQEHFQAFGEKLFPILQSVGVDPGEPTVSPVHNIVRG
jgi:hypothetical protein